MLEALAQDEPGTPRSSDLRGNPYVFHHIYPTYAKKKTNKTSRKRVATHPSTFFLGGGCYIAICLSMCPAVLSWFTMPIKYH